jgi:hypothetical protein
VELFEEDIKSFKKLASKEVFPANATPNNREKRKKKVRRREKRIGPLQKKKKMKADPMEAMW